MLFLNTKPNQEQYLVMRKAQSKKIGKEDFLLVRSCEWSLAPTNFEKKIF